MKEPSVSDQINSFKEKISIDFSVKTDTERFVDTLVHTLLDKYTATEEGLHSVEALFVSLAAKVCDHPAQFCVEKWKKVLAELPSVLGSLEKDANAFESCDPASTSLREIYLAYPGLYAIVVHRLAHLVQQIGMPLIPRLMSELAHSRTGVDIHPSAKIGSSFFIDHATGVVIGETCEIGDHVRIYQGVTLGALFVEKQLSGVKRHPSIGNHVTIYANATILGGETHIGDHAIIGGNTWITESVPPHATVYHKPEITIKAKR